MNTEYLIWVCDSAGRRMAQLGSLMSMRAGQSVNDVGVLELVFSSEREYSQFGLDSIIEVYRQAPGGMRRLLFDTVWFARVFNRARSNGVMLYQVKAFSLNYLLTGRYIPYPKGGANALMTDYADDMLKAVMRENLGALASDATRNLGSVLTVQSDRSAAPEITKEFAYRPLLSTLQEIAASSAALGTALYFDIVATDTAAWQFRTYTGQRGTDHSFVVGADPLEVSEERGNLVDPSLTLDYSTEVTHVYVGGQGEGIARLVHSVQDTNRIKASPYNRREMFIDAQNADGTDALGDEGSAELRAGRPRIVFEGQLADIPGARYGVNWSFGDRVGARFAGYVADCRVDGVEIGLDSSGRETINARLREDT